MEKKKICFIAQFPPPIHGLSKAVDTLYNSYLNKEFEFEKIDITNNKNIIKNIIKIFKNKSDLFYFTVSQTKGGNIRDLIILKLLELQRKKCLIHLHGGYYRKLINNDINSLQSKLNYKAISKLEGVIVLSESLKEIFKGMISKERIYVVENCVDNNFLTSDIEFDEKLKKIEEKEILHVLYLSNFIKTKGYQEVLNLARLEKLYCERMGNKRYHFDFAGGFFDESDKNFFFKYIKDYELQDYITYHGIVNGNEKKKLLKESDIFILLTRYPKEGQPISILEAMGNGMAIITTDHAGIPDIVEDGVNGKLLKINFASESILDGLNEKENLKEIMIRNRKKCKENFTEDQYLSGMSRLFKEVGK